MDTSPVPSEERLTHQQKQAFRAIELIAQWEGRLNTSHLTRLLAITRQSASRLINDYKALNPQNLRYNASLKCYEPSEVFSASQCSLGLEAYMQMMADQQVDSASFGDFPVLRINSGHHTPSPAVVRPIIQAIQNRLRLDVAYASITSPDFEERIICPHTLINDGHRWHVRAWCEKNQDFRDFVLTRIRDVFNAEGMSPFGREQDQGWNTWVTFSIEPDPRLNAARRRIVAMDYGMTPDVSGNLTREYRVRGALLIYWLQQLRVDRYRERPEAQQIILTSQSRADLEPWLR